MTDIQFSSAKAHSFTEATKLIYQTDPVVWDYLFGAETGIFERFVSGLWQLGKNSFAHSEATGLTHSISSDGNSPERLCGLELGYVGKNESALTASASTASIDFIPSSAVASVLEKTHDIEYLTPNIPDDAYYLHFLSVDKNYKGQGLGRRLLENCFEKAKKLNCPSIHLDVYTTNPAVDIYKSFGFRIVVETTFPNKVGLPKHYRMIKDL